MVAQKRSTPEAYLQRERRAETKSEYIGGCIVAMAGASFVHNQIVSNVIAALHRQLDDRPCQPLPPDMRVKNLATGGYSYPDVTVVCGEPELEDDAADTLLNPVVIVEVLSPTTERYDRGDKFAAYRRLPSLQGYVLIAQDRVQCEHYRRLPEGWLLTVYAALDDLISLPELDCALPLRAVYQRVRLDLPASDSNESRGNPTDGR